MKCPQCGQRMTIVGVTSEFESISYFLTVTAECHNYATQKDRCVSQPRVAARFIGRTLVAAMAKANLAGWWPTTGQIDEAMREVEQAPL